MRRVRRTFEVLIVSVVACATFAVGGTSTVLADGTVPLHYHGGNVIASPHAFLVFWGSQWKQSTLDSNGYSPQQVIRYLETFFQNVGGSYWLSAVTQYYESTANGTVYISNPAGQFNRTTDEWIDDVDPIPANYGEFDVNSEVGGPIVRHFGRYNNYATDIYMVFTPPGYRPRDLGSACAYHGIVAQSPGYVFGYVPYLPSMSGCTRWVFNDYDSFGHGPLDPFSIAAGHEYAEAITDPQGPQAISGWWDYIFGCSLNLQGCNSDEIGDKCAAGTNEFPTYGATWLGNQQFAVQGLWSNVIPGCSLLPGVAPSPYPTCTTPGLNASPTSGQLSGNVVTFSAMTDGCPTPNYQFSIQAPGGAWTINQPYGTRWRFSWTAPIRPGAYGVKVEVRDQTSSGAADATTVLNYSVVSTASDSLSPGQTLSGGQYLLSPNGRYELIMQGDGNLVLYSPTTYLWATWTQNHPGDYLLMQGDGNLVIYRQGGSPADWSSRTAGNPGAYLLVQNDGNVVMYHQGGINPVWSTNTCCNRP